MYPKRWLSCFKAGHRQPSKEFIDDEFAKSLLNRIEASDYTDKEAIELLNFLHKFNSEFHKNVIKKGDRKALHRTQRLRSDCYARENARNRDVLSAKRHKVSPLERTVTSQEDSFTSDAFIYSDDSSGNHEDVLIDLIDFKKFAFG